MTKWEYDRVEVHQSDLLSVMDEMGEEGWEAFHVEVSYYEYTVLFKRPKREG